MFRWSNGGFSALENNDALKYMLRFQTSTLGSQGSARGGSRQYFVVGGRRFADDVQTITAVR
jgi:hypothetical protein